VAEEKGWDCSWEDARRRQLTAGLRATPAQRLAWLEEMIFLAHRAGALRRGARSATGDSVLRDAADQGPEKI
jgi:hypothetical protein